MIVIRFHTAEGHIIIFSTLNVRENSVIKIIQGQHGIIQHFPGVMYVVKLLKFCVI